MTLRKLVVTLCGIISILSFSFAQTPKIGADVDKIEKTIYISSSKGENSNSGTKESPLKSFKNIPHNNARILLMRGDIFYDSLSNLNNCIIDSYGDKNKPLPAICGLRKIENPNAWKKESDDVWILDMQADKNFSGRNPPESQRNKIFNNIGGIYDLSTDTLYGRVLKSKELLKENWDMIVTENYKGKDVTLKALKFLRLKLDHNPSKYADLHLITYGNAISRLNHCTIENIAIKGFGRHGLTSAKNSKIKNIEIDLIGGSILVGYPNWVRLGNGIEFWITDEPDANNNNYVEGCIISRTFDCGATIQGKAEKGKAHAKNITFVNNKFYRCRQAFEHWLQSSDNKGGIYENCKFVNNFVWDMGNNEFNFPYPQDLNFLTYDRGVAAMTIRNNICYGTGAYTGSRTWSTDFGDNVFYIEKGKPLTVAFGAGKPSETVYANTDEDIEKYRKITGDSTSKIIIVNPDDSTLKQKLLSTDFEYVKKFLNTPRTKK